jgi:hypothetical protein
MPNAVELRRLTSPPLYLLDMIPEINRPAASSNPDQHSWTSVHTIASSSFFRDNPLGTINPWSDYSIEAGRLIPQARKQAIRRTSDEDLTDQIQTSGSY